MIVGFGIGLLEAPRFERALRRHGERLRTRLFSEAERRSAADRDRSSAIDRLAVRFAAKSAARRALGVRGLAWRDFEVVGDTGGAPSLRFQRGAARALRRLRISRVSLTLAHDAPACVAQVILEDGA